MVAAAMTDPGRVRPINEDAVIAADPVFMVADGMGGHEAGDAASAIVAEEMTRLRGLDHVAVPEVKARIDAARRRIMALGSSKSDKQAGTTISGVVVTLLSGQPYWLVVNLGDSRTYRFANQELEQLSVDHSEVQDLIKGGRLSPEQARGHPRRNVVTKALGAGALFEPDYWLVPIDPQDRILVCSDGLTTEVPDNKIAGLLAQHPDANGAAEALMAEALLAGAPDNVSVVVVNANPPSHLDETTVNHPSLRCDQDTIPRAQLEQVPQP